MTDDERLDAAISCAHANCDDIDAPPICDKNDGTCRYVTGEACDEWEADLSYLLGMSYDEEVCVSTEMPFGKP